jgi:hypothetical protein
METNMASIEMVLELLSWILKIKLKMAKDSKIVFSWQDRAK